MGVFIGGKQIAEVTCSNKKDGRKEVADKALRSLIASGDYKASSTASVSIDHYTTGDLNNNCKFRRSLHHK